MSSLIDKSFENPYVEYEVYGNNEDSEQDDFLCVEIQVRSMSLGYWRRRITAREQPYHKRWVKDWYSGGREKWMMRQRYVL